MRIDQAPEGGKFRATAATALGGTAGAWGDADMLCVDLDSSGELIVSSAGDNVVGVIWTLEGRKADVTDNNKVIAGRKYTVFTFAELVEVTEGNTSPALSAGDKIYATALGDIVTTGAAGDVFIGSVLNDGDRLLVNVNGRPVA